MTENTVLLNVEEYNRLRDFWNGLEEGKFVSIDYYHNRVYYMKETEVLEKLKDRIAEQKKELNSYKKPNEKTVEDVKKMSLWQFVKWRNKRG